MADSHLVEGSAVASSLLSRGLQLSACEKHAMDTAKVRQNAPRVSSTTPPGSATKPTIAAPAALQRAVDTTKHLTSIDRFAAHWRGCVRGDTSITSLSVSI